MLYILVIFGMPFLIIFFTIRKQTIKTISSFAAPAIFIKFLWYYIYSFFDACKLSKLFYIISQTPGLHFIHIHFSFLQSFILNDIANIILFQLHLKLCVKPPHHLAIACDVLISHAPSFFIIFIFYNQNCLRS